jgi:hypothetical protein
MSEFRTVTIGLDVHARLLGRELEPELWRLDGARYDETVGNERALSRGHVAGLAGRR